MGIFSKFRNVFKKKEKDESLKIYDDGLRKTRESFLSKIIKLNNKYDQINEDYYDELEEILIMADVGVETTFKLIDKIKERVRKEKIEKPDELKEIIVDELFIIYIGGNIVNTSLNLNSDGLSVILFVGVNGVGKTTTIAKIASKLKEQKKSIKMIAADTFRAGAVEQLKEWAKRTDSSFYSGKEGEDPSSVIHKGIEEALNDKTDIVLIDTAGRLQNKENLMQELAKMKRVISNLAPNSLTEVLLVLDATTGQNGISQAEAFNKLVDVTGIVITKLDSTAKGGIILGIKEKVNIPVKFVGLGEKKEDLQVFDLEKYIYGLFKEMF